MATVASESHAEGSEYRRNESFDGATAVVSCVRLALGENNEDAVGPEEISVAGVAVRLAQGDNSRIHTPKENSKNPRSTRAGRVQTTASGLARHGEKEHLCWLVSQKRGGKGGDPS